MKVNDESNNNKEKNEFEEDASPDMILTIDIGNNQLKKLNIYDIDNIFKDSKVILLLKETKVKKFVTEESEKDLNINLDKDINKDKNV